MTPAATDNELIACVVEGSEDAFRSIVERHGPLVFTVAWRILRRANLAEEAAQDTFLALWMKPEVFDPERGNLRAFLLRIARNKSIDRVRREEARREDLTFLDDEEMPDQRAGLMAENVVVRMDVREALDGLTDLQREAIVLVYFGGRSSIELAEELGIPEGTAKTRLRDGLQRLRKLRGDRE